MTRAAKHIKLLLLTVLALTAVSCEGVLDHTRQICDYTAELVYHYNQENTSPANQFARYVKTAEEYIFDGDGILYAINPVSADPCTGEMTSKVMLPPGRYTVITVGNRTAMSLIHDGTQAAPAIGRTRREAMTLTLVNRSKDGTDDGVHCKNTGRLYHGYRTFTVTATDVSRIRVDMVHSHLDLMYTIRWKGNRSPVNSNDFYVLLTDVPSEYELMPEYIYTEPYCACAEHDPASAQHDPYNITCQGVRHHIPCVERAANIKAHRQSSNMFGNTISGQTISYRIRNCGTDRTATTISLHSASQGRLMKEIHLNDFLNRNNINLDQTLKQQYHIVFEIDPDTGKVDVWFAEIADWDEGGYLGG